MKHQGPKRSGKDWRPDPRVCAEGVIVGFSGPHARRNLRNPRNPRNPRSPRNPIEILESPECLECLECLESLCKRGMHHRERPKCDRSDVNVYLEFPWQLKSSPFLLLLNDNASR